MDWTQVVAAVLSIAIANFGFLKFLLKDVHKQQEKFDNEHKEFREDMKKINMRMDGLYKVLLDRTYGVKE